MSAIRRSALGIVLSMTLLAAGVTVTATSAAGAPSSKSAAARLRADGRNVTIQTGAGGRVSFITGTIPVDRFSNAKNAADVARDFFGAYGAVFGISDQGAELKLRSTRSDRQGWTHVSFDQV